MSANLRFLIIALAVAAALLSITTLVRASEISDSGSIDNHNHAKSQRQPATATAPKTLTVRQDEASIFYLKQMIKIAEEGSHERADAEKELADLISHRKHIDESMRAIVKVLVVNGQINASMSSRVFDINTKAATDWKCVKTIVANFQAHCGALRFYGLKYNTLFINLCDAGVTPHQWDVASLETCPSHTVNPKWMAEDKIGFYDHSRIKSVTKHQM